MASQPVIEEENPIKYLRSLPSIRARCSQVHELAKQGRLQYFDYHEEKEKDVIDYCAKIIQRDFGTNYASIPPHGRWRHFNVNHPRIELLRMKWATPDSLGGEVPNQKEICARLLDLFLVSVLLDAGAGNTWKYKESDTGEEYNRSEGLAIASLEMFVNGFFSGDSTQKTRVDAAGLSKVTASRVGEAMQVSSSNPMAGLEGRASLLTNLGAALLGSPSYFGKDARPGNIIYYLESHPTTGKSETSGKLEVHISALWKVLIEGLAPIWPTDRTNLRGVPLGDVWPCESLAKSVGVDPKADSGGGLVPFHKLSQWLAYSLVEPIEKLLGWEFIGMQDMTGLPEYRNGGLLVDLGVLSLKKDAIAKQFHPNPSSPIPRIPPSHPAIIEWRAMTVIELDRIAEGLRAKLNFPSLTLPQVLESATWKGGREIAKELRGSSGGGPPIEIESDGTVF